MRACCKAFAEDRDIHQATAAEVLGLPAGEVSADQRRSAKAVNFGLIYGMSAFGLARQLGISRGDAQRYVDLYFQRYPGVKRYMDETRAQARELGYVETVFGRRLYLPEIRSRDAALRQYAERSAINAPMQGTAADIIKRAMIEVDAWLQTSGLPARIIMQVHDELILEAADDGGGTPSQRGFGGTCPKPRNLPCRSRSMWAWGAIGMRPTRITDWLRAGPQVSRKAKEWQRFRPRLREFGRFHGRMRKFKNSEEMPARALELSYTIPI